MKKRIISLLLALCVVTALFPAQVFAGVPESGTAVQPAAVQVTASQSGGWIRNDNGTWSYLNANGKPATGWLHLDRWYFFDTNGIMQTGWIQSGGKWYFLDRTNGDMKTGWVQSGGKWYFLDRTNGDMKTGWLLDGGKWYFLDKANGDMKTGWLLDGGKWYFLDKTGGHMRIGWVSNDGKWYFLNKTNGDMKTGWLLDGGKWYFLDKVNGDMKTGWIKDGSKWYYMGDDGAMVAELPSDTEAYDRIIAQKANYPEGKPWTNDNSYVWYDRLYPENWSVPYNSYTGFGCVGFAMILSDAAYGDVPARMVENYQYSDLHVGDILRINGDTHSVSILEIYSDYVVIAEGNYNSSIHWGRTLTKSRVMAGNYIITRWP